MANNPPIRRRTSRRDQPAFVVPHPNTARGLTKREYAIIHIAAGLAASPCEFDACDIAQEAIEAADQIFDNLEEPTDEDQD